MKNKLVLAIVMTAVILSGCTQGADAATEEKSGEEVIASSEEQASEEESVAEEANTEDYTDQIKAEIDGIAADSLSDELVKANEIYDKYDELRRNAKTQLEMNFLGQWGTLVWKDETLRLLDQLKEKDPANYDDCVADYEEWEKYVPSMAERMSSKYKDGSIYPTIYSYNEAMRYKEMAYVYASTLADLKGEVDFSFPDSSPCGYYGDYTKDGYLCITEGMEAGTYDIVVHIDDSKEICGTGTISENPDALENIMFTSEDGKVKGEISCFALEGAITVTESDGSVVEPNETYSFTFRY